MPALSRLPIVNPGSPSCPPFTPILRLGNSSNHVLLLKLAHIPSGICQSCSYGCLHYVPVLFYYAKYYILKWATLKALIAHEF